MNAKNNYTVLIDKLDEFIRKYYLNKFIKGLLIAAVLLLSLSLLFISIEYFFYLSAPLKTALVLIFLFILIGSIIYLLLLPIFAYFKLGKHIDHGTAANIIGNHFPHVADRLLNTLQLHNSLENNSQRELILAGIDQKIENLKPIPFKTAVKIYENKKIAKYVLLPIAVIILLAFTAPALLTDGSYRMVNYRQDFVKPAPFSFHLQNKQLKATQNDDFTLKVQMEGEKIPASIYLIDEDGHQFKMQKSSNVDFHYSFKNLQQSRTFQLYGNGVYSENYRLVVLPKPAITDITIRLNYPNYLNKPDETISNTGELKVPAGTHIHWTFGTQNTESLRFSIYGKTQNLLMGENERFQVTEKIIKPTKYSLRPSNSTLNNSDSLSYRIAVIPDDYPKISVKTQADSLSNKRFYHIGKISDDYGLTKLRLVILGHKSGKETKRYVPIAFSTIKNSQYFFYSLNINKLGIEAGEKARYYFEVFDNDAVNGPKATRSSIQSIYQPTFAENAMLISKKSVKVGESLKEAANKTRQIQEEAQRLNLLLVQQKELGFDDKKRVLDLLAQQKILKDFLKKIQQENKQNTIFQDESTLAENREIEKKQELFNKLLEQIVDPETKKILEELEKLIRAENKTAAREKLNSIRQDSENAEKELERLMELYKQLKFDELLQQNIQQLEKIAGKQKEIAGKTKGDKAKNEKTLLNEQKLINKLFGESKKQLTALKKQEKQLKNSSFIEKSEELQNSIELQLSQSTEQLANGKRGKASENQKGAAAKMKQLASKLQKNQEQSVSMQLSINLHALRQILDNLVQVSFEQEDLMVKMKKAKSGSPLFNELIKKQLNIKNELKMVQDSVYSLSKKVPQLSTFVNRETEKINNTLSSIFSQISNKRPSAIALQQQNILTSVNNLALMLSELQQQLQKMMNQSKRNGRGQSLQQLGKMQQSLNEKLNKAKEGLKPGERIPNSMSEQMARMAKEQEAIRNSLKKIARELSKNSPNASIAKAINEMDKTVTELYNKQLSAQMLLRQKNIRSRLLEAENAENEQNQSKEREAKQGQQISPGFIKSLDKFNAKQKKQLELPNTLTPSISIFYQQKINKYYNLINNNNNNNINGIQYP